MATIHSRYRRPLIAKMTILPTALLLGLSITRLLMSVKQLKNLFSRLEQLTSLSLVNCQDWTRDSQDWCRKLEFSEAGHPFWQTLAKNCSRLRTISFAVQDRNKWLLPRLAIPLALFPFVVGFGMEQNCASLNSISWWALSVTSRIENRLASLEIVGEENTTGVRILDSKISCAGYSVLHHFFYISKPRERRCRSRSFLKSTNTH